MSQEPRLPLRIGPWEIVDKIGFGGHGVVYRGQRTTPSGRQVAAVKIIAAELLQTGAGSGAMARFRREIAALMAVHDPGVPRVVASDPDDDPAWYATDFIEGSTLAKTVSQQGALEPDAWLELAVSLLGTLARVHDQRIAHRDIKPANIMLGPSGAVLIDFGIATVLGGTSMTVGGRSPQTRGWNSPEQIVGQRAAGPASDVFSLGLVLAWAATGHHPFDPRGEADLHQLEEQILNGRPDLSGVPPSNRRLLEVMLTQDPDLRPDATECLTMITEAPTSGGRINRDGHRDAPRSPDSLAAERGDSEAMFRMGRRAEQEAQRNIARAHYTQAAEAGNSDAMFRLGRLSDQDGEASTARTWYLLAASKGNSTAMNNLGVLAQEVGDGEAARAWYTLAAESGSSLAMTNLGRLAERQGDLSTARGWYTRAADEGDRDAIFQLIWLASREGDRKAALHWFGRTAA